MKDRNILILDNISKKGLDSFREGYSIYKEGDTSYMDEGKEEKGDIHGILLRSHDMHHFEFPDSLRAIARAGVGLNNIPIDLCSEKGIVVMSTPGANANAVKEMVLAAMLLSSRDIVGGINWVRAHSSGPDIANIARAAEKAKKAFAGEELMGKTLGVIGLGAIGVIVANLATSFGMEVLGYDPYILVRSAWRLNRSVRHEADLDELFSRSDFITVHVPATDSMRNLLNKDSFKKMKDGVKIINFSRDFVVNESDIKESLESGKVAAYFTDFATPMSVNMPNTIVTPHLGASTKEAEENCALMAVRELEDYLDNGNISHSANFPDVNAGTPRTESRIGLLHRNVPGMLGALTAIMGESNINIANLQNASRDKYAYTLIDIESRISDKALLSLRAIDGMLRVRIVK